MRAYFLMVARRCCHCDIRTEDVCGIRHILIPLYTGFEIGDGPMMDGASRRIHTHTRFSCYIIRTQSVYILTVQCVSCWWLQGGEACDSRTIYNVVYYEARGNVRTTYKYRLSHYSKRQTSQKMALRQYNLIRLITASPYAATPAPLKKQKTIWPQENAI